MNNFTKRLKRLVNKKTTAESITPAKASSSTYEYHQTGKANVDMSDTSQLDGKTVDIPLFEELTEQHGVTGFSMMDVSEVDFDLTADQKDITGLPGNMLNIDPVKSFSKPVDLNLDNLQSKGFITPTNANTPLSNSFRMVKRPILNNATGKMASPIENGNLVMVTSSVSEEGKSFCAINLALSIAMEKNKRVLLIDADVNKPSHHAELGIESGLGLTDYLSGKIKDMSHIMYKTNIPTLTLMFAGTLTSHATELLASEGMENFVKEISTRYPDRIVIFDSPPLLMTTEASVLASHMGQIVMVVEAEKTLRYQVKKSMSLLTNEVVMVLLNKMREKGDAGNYGYYGYGHQS